MKERSLSTVSYVSSLLGFKPCRYTCNFIHPVIRSDITLSNIQSLILEYIQLQAKKTIVGEERMYITQPRYKNLRQCYTEVPRHDIFTLKINSGQYNVAWDPLRPSNNQHLLQLSTYKHLSSCALCIGNLELRPEKTRKNG